MSEAALRAAIAACLEPLYQARIGMLADRAAVLVAIALLQQLDTALLRLQKEREA